MIEQRIVARGFTVMGPPADSLYERTSCSSISKDVQSTGERWIKRSPLRTLISLLRSFDYAAQCNAIWIGIGAVVSSVVRPRSSGADALGHRVGWVHDAFLRGYLTILRYLVDPADKSQCTTLFASCCSNSSCRDRVRAAIPPHLAGIPLTGLLEALSGSAHDQSGSGSIRVCRKTKITPGCGSASNADSRDSPGKSNCSRPGRVDSTS